MGFVVHRTNVSRAVCGECGNINEDVTGPLKKLVCPICGSADLFFNLTDVEHTKVYFEPGRRHLRVVFDEKFAEVTLKSRLAYLLLRAWNWQSQPRKRKISPAPGSLILRIADFLYSPVTVEKIFKQEIADWRHEYFEALKDDRNWKARWICCRHYWAIAKAVSLDRLVFWFDRVLRRI